MRPIDGDKLVSIFAQRKEVWRGNGVLPSNESLMWLAAMDITANIPTIDAVPLDKLCEMLSAKHYCLQYPNDPASVGRGRKSCKECWKQFLTAWMEEQDAKEEA